MENARQTRRRHSAELKARVLEACRQPGASVARVALENGLNTNLVHKWRQRATEDGASRPVMSVPEFVPLPILPAVEVMSSPDIRISIRHGSTRLDIQWPVSSARSCAEWLGEVLK
jgi:transposase